MVLKYILVCIIIYLQERNKRYANDSKADDETTGKEWIY